MIVPSEGVSLSSEPFESGSQSLKLVKSSETEPECTDMANTHVNLPNLFHCPYYLYTHTKKENFSMINFPVVKVF